MTPIRPTLLAIALVSILGACGGSDSSSSAAGKGTLGVSLTDAPACGFSQVNVTVTALRFNRQSTAGENDGGWEELVIDNPQPMNLLDLTDGRLAALGDLQLPAGTYKQARLVLAKNSGNELSNSIVLEGETTARSLKTPSAQTAGSKIKLDNVQVEEGAVANLVVDFDACRSVVTAGASGNYILKPKLMGMMVAELAQPKEVTGSLGENAPVAMVSAQSHDDSGNPVILKADETDPATGEFKLSPFDEESSTVDLVIRMPDQPIYILTGVPTQGADLSGLSDALAAAAPLTDEQPTETSASIAGSINLPDGTEELPVGITAIQNVAGKNYLIAATDFAASSANSDYSLLVPTRTTRVAAYGETITFTSESETPLYQLGASAEEFTVDPTTHDNVDPNATGNVYDFSLTPVVNL